MGHPSFTHGDITLDLDYLIEYLKEEYPKDAESLEELRTWGLYPEKTIEWNKLNLDRSQISSAIIKIAEPLRSRALKVLPDYESMSSEEISTWFSLKSIFDAPNWNNERHVLDMYCMVPFHFSKLGVLNTKSLSSCIKLIRWLIPQLYPQHNSTCCDIMLSARIISVLKEMGLAPADEFKDP